MKKLFSRLIKNVSNLLTNLTPTSKLRYVVISVVTVTVATSLLIVSLNTNEPETPTNPEDFETGETQTIDFDNEIIFEIGGESSSVDTTDVITEDNSVTTDEASGTKEPTSAGESTNVQIETNTKPIGELEPQPTDPSQDYNADPQPEDTTNTPVVNSEPTGTTTQTQTTPKPTETTTKATQAAPKPTETTKSPQTEPKPTEATKTPQTQPKPTETTTTAPQTTAKPTETTKSQETEPQPAGQFSLKEKKYDYNGTNVTILQVENKSQQAYTITITGKFKDANGNTVKTESKTFEGFPAGWSNHFVFQPGVKYSSVTWGMEMNEFTEETFAQYYHFGNNAKCNVSPWYSDGKGNISVWPESSNYKLYSVVTANIFQIYHSYSGLLEYTAINVIFDSNGKIFLFSDLETKGNQAKSTEGSTNIPLYATNYVWEDRDMYTLPDNLLNVSAIISVISVREY